MFISKFKLLNYKSFLDSGELEFKPGINIISGQNSSGKTALLEALTLNYSNIPHRSLKTLPDPNSRLKLISQTNVSLNLTEKDILLIKNKVNSGSGIFKPSNISPEEAISSFEAWIKSSKDFTWNLPISSGDFLIEETSQSGSDYLSFGLYSVDLMNLRERQGPELIIIEKTENESLAIQTTGQYTNWDNISIAKEALRICQSKIYRFFAERLNVSTCNFGTSNILSSNASNLAEVLNTLQGNNSSRFNKFNKLVSLILPQIKRVTVRPQSGNMLEIMIWHIDPDTEREDLAFSLSSCGTGVGQILAILYVLVTSQNSPKIIIIDEPQSFLHPGAAKKLIRVLKNDFPEHQYFISTHSPEIISAAESSTIVKLQYRDSETLVTIMNTEDTAEQRLLLAEIGVSLSDIFGADNILWVEGPTEEMCFPLIIQQLKIISLKGTSVLALKDVGSLEGKRSNLIFDIYERLSGGKNLFPTAIGFYLDSENRSETNKKDFKRRNSLLEFLPRCMYENYLLHPEAIAAVANNQKNFRPEPLTEVEVEEWLEKKKIEKKYYFEEVSSDWLSKIRGAKLLEDLFAEFSEARVAFLKPKHPFELTKWLLENKPNHFSELSQTLKELLDRLNELSKASDN
jgi:predicted ATPase